MKQRKPWSTNGVIAWGLGVGLAIGAYHWFGNVAYPAEYRVSELLGTLVSSVGFAFVASALRNRFFLR